MSQTQQSFACTEKQLTDQRVLRGEVLKPPKSTPIKGKPLFVDPTFARIVELEYLRKLREKDREVKRKADKYQEMLWTIPQADYYPTPALAEIRSHSSTRQQIDRMEEGEDHMNVHLLRQQHAEEQWLHTGFFGGGVSIDLSEQFSE